MILKNKILIFMWGCRIIPVLMLLILAITAVFELERVEWFILFLGPILVLYLAVAFIFIPALMLSINKKYSDLKLIVFGYLFSAFTFSIGPIVYYWLRIDPIFREMTKKD